MGSFTLTKWKCDRCGKVEDKRPTCTRMAQLSGGYYYADGPGPTFNWKELCAGCNERIANSIDIMLNALRQEPSP